MFCYLLIVTILTIMKCVTFQNWVCKLSFGLCWDINWSVITGPDVTEKANQTESSTQDTFAVMGPHLNVPLWRWKQPKWVVSMYLSLCFMLYSSNLIQEETSLYQHTLKQFHIILSLHHRHFVWRDIWFSKLNHKLFHYKMCLLCKV